MPQAKISETETEEGSLGDFSFSDENEFFGVKPDTLGSEKVMKQVKAARVGDNIEDDDDGVPTNLDEEKEKDKKKAKKKEEVDDEDDDNEDTTFFEEEKPKAKEKEAKPVEKKEKAKETVKEKEEEEEETVEEKVDDEDSTEFYTTLAEELKEKGIFSNIELPKNTKITEDQFFELQDQEIEARLDETFEAFFKEMDDEGRDFLKFKRTGGDTRTFITQYASTLDLNEFDDENPDQVDKVIDHYLKVYEKLDKEDFEDRKKYIIDSGKQKATAARYFKTIQKDDKERKEAIIKIQEQSFNAAEERRKEFNNSIKELLADTQEIGAFTFTKTDQKELDGYITKPTIKVGKNKYIPAFQNDLAKVLRAVKKEDKEDLILLAKLLKSKFDVKDIAVQAKTAVAKKVKSKLEDAKKGTKLSTSGAYTRKALADYIDE